MAYKIQILPKALKELSKIAATAQASVIAAIDNLGDNPRPSGCKKLKGSEHYRIRIGDYRVIYAIQDDVLLVVVLRIGHRKDVYD